MANLRELRRTADGLGVVYLKDTGKEELEAAIAAKMAEMSEPPPAREPVFPATAVSADDAAATSAALPCPVLPLFPAVDPALSSVEDILTINESDLMREFREQASKYRYFAGLDAQAQAKALEAKYNIDKVKAKLFLSYRQKFTDEGVKPTEKLIDASVEVDPEYQGAVAAFIQAKCAADCSKGDTESCRQRKDMLGQMGNRQRDEMNASMALRSAAAMGKMAA